MRDLVVALDDDYLLPFRVLWRSLMLTDSLPRGTSLWVLHGPRLSQSSVEVLRRVVTESGFSVEFRMVDAASASFLPSTEGDHVSDATYYRLFVHLLLPESVTSVVYLDVDTLAVRSIKELFEIDLRAPIAAVDHASPSNAWRMWGPALGDYFQAGVLVIDLATWRENNILKAFVEILDDGDRILWWDQDVLNIAFENNWQRLPVWFNVNPSIRALTEREALTVGSRLLHYSGNRKPWNNEPSRVEDSGYWYNVYSLEFGTAFVATSARGLLSRLVARLARVLNRQSRGR